MSTKTSIKRIAAVAAVALTLGGFSAVSAHAAAATTATAASTTPVVGTYNSININLGTNDKNISVTSAGVGSIPVPTIAAGSGNVATTGVTSTAATIFHAAAATAVPGNSDNDAFAAADFGISSFSATAGTQTITIKGDKTAAITITLTWGAAPVATAQYSQIVMLASTTGPANSGTAPALVSLTPTGAVTTITAPKSTDAGANTTKQAVIGVVANASATYTMGTDKITATISGPGTLSGGTSTAGTGTNGRSITITTSNGVAYFAVYADGNSGASTITFSDGAVVLGSRTATFYGAPAKATVTQNLYIAKAGSTLGKTAAAADGSSTAVTQTYAYTVEVTDANGVDVAGATVKAVSSASTVISGSSCVESTGTLGAGFWNCSVDGATAAASGATATVTFKVDPAGAGTYEILATPITFAIGGSIATQELSVDASSYAPLAPLRLITTAKDSKGNLAADVDGTMLTSLVSSVQLGGSGLTSPSKIVNGVGKTSVGAVYAPATAGDFVISAVDNVSGTAAALSVTGVSTGTSADAGSSLALDAANAATDAANNAYDEAQNATQAASDALAAVTALSAQVSALIATVKSLAAMVAKIKAKVKA